MRTITATGDPSLRGLLTICLCIVLSIGGRTSAGPSAGTGRTMRYTPRSAEEARAWQADVRARLGTLLRIDDLVRQRQALPLEPRTLTSTDEGAYRVEELEIRSTPGRRIRIVVTRPTRPQSPSPAVVCVGGHGSDLYSPYDANSVPKGPARAKADRIYRGFGTVLAARGYVTISTTVSQHDVRQSNRLLMGERLWDLMRCVDYLASLPEVDQTRIGGAGLSLGGEMTMWLGAMDERIAATVSSGFLTTMDHMEKNHCM
ncbi:MAG: hypothetical protein FJ280_11205, partial [Planctomycetes bacterium]|nr:hypothetical protein [Planctomycetota bacterium]